MNTQVVFVYPVEGKMVVLHEFIKQHGKEAMQHIMRTQDVWCNLNSRAWYFKGKNEPSQLIAESAVPSEFRTLVLLSRG